MLLLLLGESSYPFIMEPYHEPNHPVMFYFSTVSDRWAVNYPLHNSLYSGLPRLRKQLPFIQHAAATPGQDFTYLLPCTVKFRLEFKVGLLVIKALNDLAQIVMI